MILMSCYGNLVAEMESLPAENRAVPFCTTCPTGAAQFCNLCVPGNAVVGDLTVQGTLTLCNSSGQTGCQCVYDGSISWNTQETNYNQKNYQGITVFCTGCAPDSFLIPFDEKTLQFIRFPYSTSDAVISGWVITPSFSTGSLLTVSTEFEVPKDLDPSVPPIVTLHWFNPSNDPTFSTCTGPLINWEITADYFANGDAVDQGMGIPKYQQETGDIVVLYATGVQFRQQQTNILLATGPAFVPGAYGLISATRVAPSATGSESDCPSYLTVIGFSYRKTPQ